MRKLTFYIFYFVIILAYILGSYKLLNQVKINAQEVYNPRPFIICSVISYILFGLLLALDFLVIQFRSEGRWQINKTKLLIVGLPCLVYVILTILQLYVPVSLPRLFRIEKYMMFISILLGFVVGTSFYRSSIENDGDRNV